MTKSKKSPVITTELVGWELAGTVLIKVNGKVKEVKNVKTTVMEADFDRTLESIREEALSQLKVGEKA